MPLPLVPAIIAGIAAATAATGVKKGLDAKRDMNEAKSLNATSQEMAKEAEKFIEMAKENTNEAITNLGQEKIRILTTSINEFVIHYEKIKNINLKNSEGIDELKNFNPTSESFKQLKEASFEAKQVAINGIAAIGSGALLAYGTYSVVMGGLGGLLVTATTGTALTSLTGVAATNATLAWLGGGALTAGGFGMAGGMVVLGGLVAGPALAIGGTIFASQAKAALNDAYGNFDKAKVFKKQAKNIGIALKGIFTRANQLTELLQKLDIHFSKGVTEMKDIINRRGLDWQDYTMHEQQDIYKCVQLAQTIKLILDAPLLKQEGQLDEATDKVLEDGNKYLQMLSQV
ncbi:hypothetical protein RRV45_11815 [Bacillus sp. DTU_2020_1000418_1_SI_GHA_SEK_038]|uniref:hypothetical protein n=1 Tax=Bacillus sp. DTU_2020_1000418_1_SI_GHA_SEK_038 TaxID=3077585 RepID=UPI0028ECC17D|nr:hypothetical protein [Bacillus sp. DTU_2020_1000418_1_SI_GHA_SEK_038]WNS73608.1 hypothetical protein RRV45_11815 [Bacillus sp. DTU_2020_1000418_1_SI_GHA_SEK_038]